VSEEQPFDLVGFRTLQRLAARNFVPLRTLAEVAERLKVNQNTVHRLFANEPGVVVICFRRKGKRVDRTLRIPETVFLRVLTRLAKVP